MGLATFGLEGLEMWTFVAQGQYLSSSFACSYSWHHLELLMHFEEDSPIKHDGIPDRSVEGHRSS